MGGRKGGKGVNRNEKDAHGGGDASWGNLSLTKVASTIFQGGEGHSKSSVRGRRSRKEATARPNKHENKPAPCGGGKR